MALQVAELSIELIETLRPLMPRMAARPRLPCRCWWSTMGSNRCSGESVPQSAANLTARERQADRHDLGR
jgi:hypothetical protein